MSVTFSGLATGIDTDSIIEALMEIERQPIDRLENDKSYYQNRLKAFSQLDEKLKSFLDKAEAIDTQIELNSPAVSSSSEANLAATATGQAQLGSYQISVVDLAQQQKDVSQGYEDKTTALGTGDIVLTVGGTPSTITIDDTNNSLEGIAQEINDADLGVTATIINDGTDSPYRLVLSGATVADEFNLDASSLSGGPTMTNTQVAQQAHILIDGIDVYSDSNRLDSSIPGLTLDLLKADETVSTTVNVSSDQEATTAKIKEFVDAYNGIISFIADQKDADWGNDSAFRSVKRRLQDLLVTPQGTGGTFSTLSQLGFETQRDGTVTLNSSLLTTALTNDYSGVIGLFTGDSTADGISSQFADYLGQVTDSADGIYVARKESTDSNIRRIDQRILNLEARMDQKESTLRAQFSAMEDLVSGLNAQGNYLLAQLASLPTVSV